MHTNSIEVNFPFHLDPCGRMASPPLAAHLEQLIQQLLLTNPGERVNRPTLGTPLEQAVFATLGPEQMSALEAMVHGALQHWLGDRLRVEKVLLEAQGDDRLEVRVSYRTPQQPELQVTTLDLRSNP